jgi:SAM-dependent methyltransferase
MSAMSPTHSQPSSTHDREILDQFTRQANPFADMPAHSQQASMVQILRVSRIEPEHSVLDVACGPGLLSCALALHARSVIGVDLVPAMLERARRECAKVGAANLQFQLADARSLPFVDASFDRVVTRYSFHHLTEPAVVLAELTRVCRPGGLVCVIDVAPAATHREAFDHFERLRDPSHTRALCVEELVSLFEGAGLRGVEVERFRLGMQLEPQLAASFPREGDAARIRGLFEQDLASGEDQLGVGAERAGGEIHFAYPCAIVVGRKLP